MPLRNDGCNSTTHQTTHNPFRLHHERLAAPAWQVVQSPLVGSRHWIRLVSGNPSHNQAIPARGASAAAMSGCWRSCQLPPERAASARAEAALEAWAALEVAARGVVAMAAAASMAAASSVEAAMTAATGEARRAPNFPLSSQASSRDLCLLSSRGQNKRWEPTLPSSPTSPPNLPSLPPDPSDLRATCNQAGLKLGDASAL